MGIAGILVVDKNPDGADMVIQLFGKCQRLPDQTRHPVTQGVVEAFDVVGKAAVFTCRDVVVRVADGRLVVGFGQRVPQSLRARSAAVTDMHADDGEGLPVQGQPDPLLVAFVADERPQLVAFQAKAGAWPPDAAPVGKSGSRRFAAIARTPRPRGRCPPGRYAPAAGGQL